MMNLVVLYPQPNDVAKFEIDYATHLTLLHNKTGIPLDVKPYTVTKFLPGSGGVPNFYQMFSMPFATAEELNTAMSSSGMQEVAADAIRISSGGAPVILVGEVN